MFRILAVGALLLGMFSCSSKAVVADSPAPNRQVAEAEILDANNYASIIYCKFGQQAAFNGSFGSDTKVQVKEEKKKWYVKFTDCSGPRGGEYEVTFAQDKYINLDFLSNKDSDKVIRGAMTLICLGQETIGDYNLGSGRGVGFMINVESKEFISTSNKAACYVPTISWGLQGGAEISPYSMRIKKLN